MRKDTSSYQLNKDTTEAKDDQRAKVGILGHADEYFMATLDVFLNQYALGIIDCTGHRRIRIADREFALDIQRYAGQHPTCGAPNPR